MLMRYGLCAMVFYSSSCQFCCGLVYSSLLFAWDSSLWVTASTVAGVVFSAIAWLFLLNAWLKGLSKYLKIRQFLIYLFLKVFPCKFG